MHIYETLANLLEYPGDDWRLQLEQCHRQISTEHDLLAPMLKQFSKNVETFSITELQEKYTQTFDLNPVCALEIGYHLFGENYKRGIFLANLRESEAPYGLDPQTQLPDYLPVLLRLLVKLEDAELRDALIRECLLPALDKMLAALGENFYGELLQAIYSALKVEAPDYTARPLSTDTHNAGAPPELYRISSRTAAGRQRSEQL